MAYLGKQFGDEFEISVGSSGDLSGKRPTWALGAFMLPEEGGIRISSLYEIGAFAEWNAKHGDREVKKADLIVEVSGVRGNGKLLKEELYKRPAEGATILKIRCGTGHVA
eukprot:TRINITY_DN41919_c0_g1_i1.p1 TRINITY_DN41919_c0_g1~~TRINITY_DN41919_c0_g1_i1.p1  ORF type:complete len:110 (+),score=27.88 TRINITY_DN41919_c0_g1_i1:72-401(+)